MAVHLAGACLLRLRSRMLLQGRYRGLFTVLDVLTMLLLIWSFPQISNLSMKLAVLVSSTPAILATYISQTLAALMFAVTLLVFANAKGWFSQLLSSRVLVTGGEISFSIYLFHQVVIIWQYNNPWLLGWCPEGFRFAVYLAAMILASYAIWRWFECPMRRLIRQALI